MKKLENLNKQLKHHESQLQHQQLQVDMTSKEITRIKNLIEKTTWYMEHPIIQLLSYHLNPIDIAILCHEYAKFAYCRKHDYISPSGLKKCFPCLFANYISNIEWVCRGPLKKDAKGYTIATHPEDIQLLTHFQSFPGGHAKIVNHSFHDRYFRNRYGHYNFPIGTRLSFQMNTMYNCCQVLATPPPGAIDHYKL